MKQIFTFLLFTFIVLVSTSLVGQGDHFCGQHVIMEKWFAKHPDGKSMYHEAVKKTLRNINHDRTIVTDTIPVVFHILHTGGIENISDAQIRDQIRILNRDYQRQNADTANVVPVFKPLIADVGFAFGLARIDPDGNCTDGIVRHYTSRTNWDVNNFADFAYSWPREKYLNIYVVKTMNLAATAYTFLPGTPFLPPSADVIVTLHTMVGSIGTSGPGTTSRVLTHEVGHWFGLPHIWGVSNLPGVECGDDFVDDTPITKGFSACAINSSKICNSGIAENVQNYMDYSPCKLMFTKGQSDYMHATIDSKIQDRDYLGTDANLRATGLRGDLPCSLKASFTHFEKNICIGDSIKFSSQSEWRDSVATLVWKLNQDIIATDSSNQDITIKFDAVGEYVVSLKLTSGGQVDSFETLIVVTDGNGGVEAPFLYGFDNATANDLHIVDIDQDDVKWKQKSGLGANGSTGYMILESAGTFTIGATDYFETPYFDFTDVDKPALSYYYAYAKAYEDQVDSFRIEYTTDCGETWKKLPTVPTIQTMASKSGGYVSEAFVPTMDQWIKVNLTSAFRFIAKNKSSIKLRFYFRSDLSYDFANNFYLDEINILNEAISSTDFISNDDVSISPNPTSGQATLAINTDIPAKVINVSIQNINGFVIGQLSPIDQTDLTIRYGNDYNLVPGLYLIKILEKSGKLIVKKLVVQ